MRLFLFVMLLTVVRYIVTRDLVTPSIDGRIDYEPPHSHAHSGASKKKVSKQASTYELPAGSSLFLVTLSSIFHAYNAYLRITFRTTLSRY